MAQTTGLRIKVGGLSLKNPLILASGSLGGTWRGLLRYAKEGCAAVVTKTILPEPWPGNPSPRVMQAGDREVINCEGLPNIGLNAMVEHVKKIKGQTDGSFLVANIAALSVEEYVEEAVAFEKAGADVIELSLYGCPNYKPGTKIAAGFFVSDPKRIFELTRAVKASVGIPVWAKLEPKAPYDDVVAISEGKADAVVVRGAVVKNMPIDINTGKPILGHPHGIGVLTGPYLRDAGLLVVSSVARLVNLPVIGAGGVFTGEDVIMYAMAGASAVQIMTCLMRKGPKIVNKICSEIEKYMAGRGIKSLEEIRGITLKYLPPRPYDQSKIE